MERFKLVLLGEGRVGKTSILLRYVNDEYVERQESTLQASFLDKRVSVGGTTCQLSIWDTAGQERFHALGPIYYRDADGALLVYDITDAQSFAKVKQWVKELRKIVGSEISLIIAGNKIDLEKSRTVDNEEAVRYAASVGATHTLVSAKASRGLNETFDSLTKDMLNRRRTTRSTANDNDDDGNQSKQAKRQANNSNNGSSSSSSGGSNNGKLVIVDDDDDHKKNDSGGCC